MDEFMEEAFIEARKALTIGEVLVGCVFIFNGEIIARFSNVVNATKDATRHAEFVCIDQALDYCKRNSLNLQHVLPKVSVAVTVEPCIMCASGLYEFGVGEIIYGSANDRFCGITVVDVKKIYERSISVTAGVRADEAMGLLKDFYKGENPSAPVPKSKR